MHGPWAAAAARIGEGMLGLPPFQDEEDTPLGVGSTAWLRGLHALLAMGACDGEQRAVWSSRWPELQRAHDAILVAPTRRGERENRVAVRTVGRKFDETGIAVTATADVQFTLALEVFSGWALTVGSPNRSYWHATVECGVRGLTNLAAGALARGSTDEATPALDALVLPTLTWC